MLGKDHPDTATVYNNLGMVYHDKGEYDQAIEFYKKALEISEKKQDFERQFAILPQLIDAFIKSSQFNYQELANYLCQYLELLEIFRQTKKEIIGRMISFFAIKGTFHHIDLKELKAHIRYPVCQERAEEFISLVNNLARLIRDKKEEV
jgi:tetratricopeptide (TPR) repeat protein